MCHHPTRYSHPKLQWIPAHLPLPSSPSRTTRALFVTFPLNKKLGWDVQGWMCQSRPYVESGTFFLVSGSFFFSGQLFQRYLFHLPGEGLRVFYLLDSGVYHKSPHHQDKWFTSRPPMRIKIDLPSEENLSKMFETRFEKETREDGARAPNILVSLSCCLCP